MDDIDDRQARFAESVHLRDLWLAYRARARSLSRARVRLDEEIERILAWGEGAITQADIARAIGTTRQDVQESVRRQQRRRDRGEIT